MIHAGVVEDEPEAYKCFMNMPNCKTPGIEVELFDHVMKQLGLEYTLVKCDGYGYYDPVQQSWTGLLGKISRGDVDVSAVTVRLSEERLNIMKFSFPIGYYNQIYKFAPPKDMDYESFVLKPFQFNVWLVLIACLLLSSFVFLLGSRLFSDYSPLNTLLVFAWKVYGIILGQAYKRTFRKSQLIALDILGASWMLASFMSITVYATYMQSLIMVTPSPKIPFTTTNELASLLENDKWSLISLSDSPDPPRCQQSSCSHLERVLAARPIEYLNYDSPEFQRRMHSDKITYFSDEDVYKLVDTVTIDVDGFIVLKDESVNSQPVSYLFPINSTLIRKFDEQLMTTFEMTNRLKHKYLNRLRPLDNGETSNNTALSLKHIFAVFALLLFGLGFATVSFMLELIIHRL